MASSSSSASTTPMLLTPESTGATSTNQPTIVLSSPNIANGPPSSPGEGSFAMRKTRRQTAVYSGTPSVSGSPKPVKPFSRSAAKRESVLALGSIEHLQHYFTKTGIASKKNPLAGKGRNRGLVPAIGGFGHIPMSPPGAADSPTGLSFSSLDPPSSDSPDSHSAGPSTAPSRPPPPPMTPHVKMREVHPDSLLPGVIDDLSELVTVWKLDADSQQHTSASNSTTIKRTMNEPVDVLSLLRTGTRVIRSVRNYLLSLPDESTGSIRAQFRRTPHPHPTTSHGFSSAASGPGHTEASGSRPDPLALIRRSALEVLICLRDLEGTSRLPLSDDAYDAQSDGGGSRGGGGISGSTLSGQNSTSVSRMASPSPGFNNSIELPPEDAMLEGTEEAALLAAQLSMQNQYYSDIGITFSLVQVHGRYETVAVWDEESDGFEDPDADASKEKRERWDERLEVGNGWLYRQDIKMEQLEKERAVLLKYLDLVDEVLFREDSNPNGTTHDPAENPANVSASRGSERGWERERRKLDIRTSRLAAISSSSAIRSRSKGRRVSAGDTLDKGNVGLQAASALLLAGSGGKRRISTGMLAMVGHTGGRLTAEPEDMEGIAEEAIGEENGDGMEDSGEELEDDDLPDWAKRGAFDGDELGRAYTFLRSFLPLAYQYALVPPSESLKPPSGPSPEPSRSAFFESLSSGQLLCLAYNGCVRKSEHPWGFVSKEGIHDILALEKAAALDGASTASSRTGWTFRRTDNLRLWIGALKLRYMLPVQMPSQIISALPPSLLKLPSVTPSAPSSARSSPLNSPRGKSKFPVNLSASKSTDGTEEGESASIAAIPRTPPESLMFDAKVVARKDDGWEEILEKVLLRWMWKAISEQRKVTYLSPAQ